MMRLRFLYLVKEFLEIIVLEFVGEVLAPTRHFGYFGSLALFNRYKLN